MKRCLSLQCSTGDLRFIPQKCTETLAKVCENMSKFTVIKILIWLLIKCILWRWIKNGKKLLNYSVNGWKRIIYPLFSLSLALPDNGYASNWRLSMEQCKRSQPSTYLLGNIDLNDSSLVCERIPSQLQVFWVGVARQKYISIDQGIYSYQINHWHNKSSVKVSYKDHYTRLTF